MEKKRTAAKLKRKGAYLPAEEPDQSFEPKTEELLSDRRNSIESSDEIASESSTSRIEMAPRVYKRARWKHYIRFVVLFFLLFLDFGFIKMGFDAHIIHHKPFEYHMFLKECFAYLLLAFCNCTMLPSLVLEADSVEVTPDHLILNNLLFCTRLEWEQITKVVAPLYLKFAIIKTNRFFHLINKKDISNFNQLIETIQTKTDEASK